jgi:hypothetical protein
MLRSKFRPSVGGSGIWGSSMYRHRPLTCQVMLRQSPRGELQVLLPPMVASTFGGKAGQRVWFAVKGDAVVISLKPSGPYPPGRRSSNKLRRVVVKSERGGSGRLQQLQYQAKVWPLGVAQHRSACDPASG